jgi:hypothetical protein
MKKIKTLDRISPFFLPPCSVLINTWGQQWRRGKHRSVGCNTMDHAFTPKMAIWLKKRWLNEVQNCQGIRCCLAILFASLLCFNKRKWSVVVPGQTSVCGMRYHWSLAFTKMKQNPRLINNLHRQSSPALKNSKIATALKTMSWGGRHRHLALVLTDAKYWSVTSNPTIVVDCLLMPPIVPEGLTNTTHTTQW